MKIPSLFIKTPKHRRFNFIPRHYDPVEEERKQREERIRAELGMTAKEKHELEAEALGYRQRIAGSFRGAKKTSTAQADPSAGLLRLLVLTFLAVWLIAYLHYGSIALYALFLIVPFYLYLKFRKR
jgi:Flp pilus assembly protein TadB